MVIENATSGSWVQIGSSDDHGGYTIQGVLWASGSSEYVSGSTTLGSPAFTSPGLTVNGYYTAVTPGYYLHLRDRLGVVFYTRCSDGSGSIPQDLDAPLRAAKPLSYFTNANKSMIVVFVTDETTKYNLI